MEVKWIGINLSLFQVRLLVCLNFQWPFHLGRLTSSFGILFYHMRIALMIRFRISVSHFTIIFHWFSSVQLISQSSFIDRFYLFAGF